MNESILYNCQLLVSNKNEVKNVFPWEDGMLHVAGAAVYTMKGKAVDDTILKNCKRELKTHTGVLSNFRSTARLPIVCMMASENAPERLLQKGIQVYDALKKEFWNSEYLPFAAMLIAQNAEESQFGKIVERTRTIYNRMKAEHPFLTSSEDSAFCALMAMSEKTDDQLINDAEHCYQILSNNFLSANSVQSLTHVLALCDGAPEVKCEKTMELFQKLKAAGHKYGTSYELPTLGVLAMSGMNADQLVTDMIDADRWLAGQKGFGVWSSLSGKQRLMYAGMMVQKNYINTDSMQAAAVNGMIALVIAQQAAICAAIVASSVAVANSSAN